MASLQRHPETAAAGNPPLSKISCDEKAIMAQNLRLLKAILDSSKASEAPKTQARRPRAPSKTNAGNVSKSSSKTSVAKSSQPYDDASTVRPPTNLLEQRKLATATFNSSLKVLSALAKQQQVNRSENQLNEASPPRDVKRDPLQNTSPNKIVTTKHSTSVNGNDGNLGLHAQCASTALDVLRQLDENVDDHAALRKREYGAILLLERLVTLELNELACMQGSKIHEQYWKRRKGGQNCSMTIRPGRCVDIAFILVADTQAKTKEDFNLVCSFQSQILRLALLQGSQSISGELIEAVTLQKNGSPADMILWGLEEDLLAPEKAQDHLQTLSQALSRLAALGMRVQSSAKQVDGVVLLIEAQVVKNMAWKIKNSKADPTPEIWPLVHRALHQFMDKQKTKDQVEYHKIMEAVKKLQSSLRDSMFLTQIPSKTQYLLVKLAEVNQDVKTASRLLTEVCSSSSGNEKTFNLVRLAVLYLNQEAYDGATRACVEDVLSALCNFRPTDLVLTAERLLILAHLRKACLSQITATALSSGEDLAVDSKPALLRVLLAISGLSMQQFTHVPVTDQKQQQLFRLTVFKAIEAVSDAEQYAMLAVEDLLELYLNAVDECLDFLDGLSREERQSSSLQDHKTTYALKFRLSNIYWRAHLSPMVNQNTKRLPVDLASKSVTALNDIPLKQLNQAALGPRLEKLASMQSTAGQDQDSLNCLERAINHYIASDALTDAVEAAISGRSCKVWNDPTSMSFQLARVLRARYSAMVDKGSSESLESRTMMVETIPEFHTAVLLEYQTMHVMKTEIVSPVTSELIELAKKVLKLANAPQYYVWCSRFLSRFLLSATKTTSLESKYRLDLNELIEEHLSRQSVTDKNFLQSFATSSQALLHLQQWLSQGGGDTETLTNELKLFHQAIDTRTSLDDLEEVIDDFESLSNALQACAGMALALGENGVRTLCLKIRLHLSKHSKPSGDEEMATLQALLAQCYIRYGDIAMAKQTLTHVRSTTSPKAKIGVILTSVELHLACSNLKEATNTLQQAQACFRAEYIPAIDQSRTKQLEHDSIIARGADLASRLAFRQGDLSSALRLARQAAKISISIWAALSKGVTRPDASTQDLMISNLTGSLSHLNLDSHMVMSVAQASGTVFWPYMDMHSRNLRHLTDLMEHAGQYEDASYFRRKLTALTALLPRTNSVLAPWTTALFKIKYSESSGTELLDLKLEPELEQFDSLDYVMDIFSVVEALVSVGQVEKAIQILDRLPNRFTTMAHHEVESQLGRKDVPRSMAKARRGMSGRKPLSETAKRAVAGTKKIVPRPNTNVVKLTPSVNIPISFDLLLAEDRRRALVLRLNKCIRGPGNTASTVSQELLHVYAGSQYLFYEQYAQLRSLLDEAWEDLRADSMSSLVMESVVAIPCKGFTTHRKGRISFLQSGPDYQRISPGNVPSLTDLTDSISEKLHSARGLVEVLSQERQYLCPVDVLHCLSKMEARIDLLLTTMNRPFTVSSSSIVLKLLQPKDVALEREKMISDAEVATKDHSTLTTWPEYTSSCEIHHNTIDIQQINDLPEAWTIISLMLSEAGDEIIVSRVMCGRSPFLVRLPLHRSNEGEGCEEFGYEDGKEELMEIIHQANSSSHDIRGSSDKAARSRWHTDRETLDKRLQHLLSKIENTWLGGFRGILSHQPFHVEQVKQFRVMFDQCLDLHLPSRQKTILKPSDRIRIQIHDHILEIFLHLGNPDDNILDDDVIDLLYFVVDILQFNGERNAYDEIDWDSMLVKVLDALRSIHEVKLTQLIQEERHTILILDKELEMFPWEALPCLINQPVSRMPSLSAVFSRLARIRTQSPTSSAFKIPQHPNSIPGATTETVTQGTYILNPSLDLQNTQSLLEPILSSHLPHFKPVINKAPTEAEFTNHLTTSDLVLYFGHGSGAQYIRGRNIRSLDKCAVTWLMGCSSVKMTTCGKGESFGMPRWYMLGNAMAVVGCLWDVTDREIDRVSISSLAHWGLIDGEDARVQKALVTRSRKEGGKKKKKAKETMQNSKMSVKSREAVSDGGTVEEQDMSMRKRKTLVEAVQKGREASVLRYLCGAAVVVYGLPVVLD